MQPDLRPPVYMDDILSVIYKEKESTILEQSQPAPTLTVKRQEWGNFPLSLRDYPPGNSCCARLGWAFFTSPAIILFPELT